VQHTTVLEVDGVGHREITKDTFTQVGHKGWWW
jgi:hypothetical protein